MVEQLHEAFEALVQDPELSRMDRLIIKAALTVAWASMLKPTEWGREEGGDLPPVRKSQRTRILN